MQTIGTPARHEIFCIGQTERELFVFSCESRDLSKRRDRLNVILLRAFNGHAKLSQTDLFRKAIDDGVKLTQPQVRDYPRVGGCGIDNQSTYNLRESLRTYRIK